MESSVDKTATSEMTAKEPSLIAIFLIFLRLGATAFGGPIAHLGYFREEFVERRKWLDDHAYSDLVALCQFLPGPVSGQVGVAIGFFQKGFLGALVAWLGFMLPSALMMILFGWVLSHTGIIVASYWLHGLKVVAVAVIAQALWAMGKGLCPDRQRASIAVVAAFIATSIAGPAGQIGVILVGGALGSLLPASMKIAHVSWSVRLSKTTGCLILAACMVLLCVLPVIASRTHEYVILLFSGFFRAGALVFGGGHVLLPLLQSVVVPVGWVSDAQFLAGYGAAQAVPGSMVTAFAAYLGFISTQHPSGWLGAVVAIIAVFLPSFLMVIGILPFWESLRKNAAIQRAMLGVNAAVVGLLLAAFYHPVWTSAILSSSDFCLALFAFLLLVFWKAPSWLVVIAMVVATGLVQVFHLF